MTPPPVVSDAVETADAAPNWAAAVRPMGVPKQTRIEHAPAPVPDQSYASEDLERVRRLVYRVSFLVPPSFRHRRRAIRPVPGELHVDVAADRLRARFVGPAWPVHDGAQIRLRRDVPGVYVFDGDGGRWLAPGQMAAWFEGRDTGRSRSSVRIRREFGKLEPGDPSVLVCSLLAEWTNQSRAGLEPRCRGGSLPPGFRFGPWRAEITAVVPMELPRSALRADEVLPPARIEAGSGGAILAAAERAQLEPRGADGEARHSLAITNATAGRLIVLAQGLPVAWLDGGTSLTLDGLPRGLYRVGAIRPFGILHKSPRPQPVPGTLHLGKGLSLTAEAAEPASAAETAVSAPAPANGAAAPAPASGAAAPAPANGAAAPAPVSKAVRPAAPQ